MFGWLTGGDEEVTLNLLYNTSVSSGNSHHLSCRWKNSSNYQHAVLYNLGLTVNGVLSLDNKGFVRALFVDFKKAFDIVNHNILFSKLKNFNISHCLLKWFASYLFHWRQRVRVGSRVSSWKTLCGSMPQGSRLGPVRLWSTQIRRRHHLDWTDNSLIFSFQYVRLS